MRRDRHEYSEEFRNHQASVFDGALYIDGSLVASNLTLFEALEVAFGYLVGLKK